MLINELGNNFNFYYLVMIGSKDNPATETVSQVHHGRTAAEPDHVRERCP